MFQYVEAFSRHGVDGEILLTLTEQELREDLKMRQIATRRKLFRAINALRESPAQANPGLARSMTNLEHLASSDSLTHSSDKSL